MLKSLLPQPLLHRSLVVVLSVVLLLEQVAEQRRDLHVFQNGVHGALEFSAHAAAEKIFDF